MNPLTLQAKDEAAMLNTGLTLSHSFRQTGGGMVYLHGTLGMGKTTLCRAIIQALGWQSGVKSPTYTLVESYELESGTVHHFDLYRIADPEELEYIGIEDYLDQDSLCLVEWPEKGTPILPPADLIINILPSGDGRKLELNPKSDTGIQWCQSICEQL